ncbi:hypothetical protein QR680_014093 [Steinernema hermaphroditum]|uniref:Domain of unknown function DB domain-containing protein n=1 Tax=Steinernema hermaphroditum TaxID=289476 RepID=A0AA39I922_9BILA|nr:hypothetical protein QR680_014093 [Steinernema hermaphroditum]
MVRVPLPYAFCAFVAFVDVVLGCYPAGVCGGGCAPPPQPVCAPATCQPGYSCGPYGCARNRARSALTLKDPFLASGVAGYKNFSTATTAKHEPIRNIYGFKRKQGVKDRDEEKEKLDRASYVKMTNPNDLFRQCCEDRNLPDSCVSKCNFNKFTKDVLQAMFFKSDPCPIEAAADIQFCAAQGRDHRECCLRNGIHKTLAGDKCLIFCDQRAGKTTTLDYSYVPCYDRFENMKRCFFDEISSRTEKELSNLI